MSHDPIPEVGAEVTPAPAIKDFSKTMTRKEREQLKALSSEVFGKSSRWQSLYENKYYLTHKIKEVVPATETEEEKEIEKEVPLLFNGSKQWRIKYRTTAEVLQLLLDFKAKRDAYLEQARKAQEDAKIKADEEAKAKQIQEDLGGSALT